MAQSPANKPDKKSAKKGGGGVAARKGTSDLKLIRLASIVFSVSLLLSVGLVYLSNDHMEKRRGELGLANQQRDESRQKLERAHTEEREIREYLALYERFMKQGIIGEEQRLNWIEALQAAYKVYKLYPVDYVISPQQTVQLDPSINASGMELHASQIVLKSDLLHEGDLINLLSSLRKSAHNFLAAKECVLERQKATVQAQLTSECTLYWLTMGEHKELLPEGAIPPR
ncbi:MAG: hypothetical protein KGZ83_05795 [Sulfuricella sp.]|nr:hypothetical protein [Sulfuricella sp.]